MRTFILTIFIQIFFSATNAQIFENKIFDINIRTIECYPKNEEVENKLITPIISLGSDARNPITIEFDYLGGNIPYMVAKIIHCDWDWKKSVLMENEFITEFNEVIVNDIEQSGAGYIPYHHVRIEMPPVKLSGNYVIVVYDEEDKNKIYLTWRYCVYENLVNVGVMPLFSNQFSNMRNKHGLEFTVNHGKYPIQNPAETMHVTIRQNERWDNAIVNLKPAFFNFSNNSISYNSYMAGENEFNGLKEFRNVDFSDLTRPRFNVDSIRTDNMGNHIFVRRDINRKYLNYMDEPDNNGKFMVANRRFGRPEVDADYIWVHFTLNSETEYEVPIYIFGGLTNWELKDEFKMNYDAASNAYKARVLLKQGEYNYMYAAQNEHGKPDETVLEGNHSRTRNSYDLIIYHRPFGVYHDKIIAYKRVN